MGRFYSVSFPPDLAIYSKWEYMIVSGSEIAPIPPPVGSSVAPASSSVDAIVRAALIATPLVALFVLVPVYIRRRRDLLMKRTP